MEKAVPIVAATATAPPAPICTVTVKDAVEAFLQQYEPTVSHQTFLGEKTNTNNITRIMGDMMVKDISFDDLQNLVNMISKGKSGKQELLSGFMDFIINRHETARVFCSGKERPHTG